jgi:hypothetical protein
METGDPHSFHPQPVILESNTLLLICSWLAAGFALIGGIAAYKEHPITATCIIVVMGLGVLVLPVQLLKQRRLQLKFTESGLSWRTPRAEMLYIPWHDVTGIRVGWLPAGPRIRWRRHVFIDYRRHDRPTDFCIWPPFYGMNAESLVELVTPYYEAAQRQPPSKAAD